MSWVKFDDGHDDGDKVRRTLREGLLGLAAIGLHTLAATQSARRETDGLVVVDWLDEKLHRLTPRERGRLMDVVVRVGFFDVLPAGESVELTDTKGFTVAVGPIDEDAHLVHDYLVYNDSSAYLEERRVKDSARKAAGGRNGNPSGVREDSARNPSGIRPESTRLPKVPTRPDQTIDPPGPPPSGGRGRTRTSWEITATAFAHSVLPHLEPRQAFGDLSMVWMRMGSDAHTASRDEVLTFIRQHKPELLDEEGQAA